MEIPKSKFNISDKVYTITNLMTKTLDKNCNRCDGEGKVYKRVIYDNIFQYESLECDVCNGNKKTTEYIYKYKVRQVIITGINYVSLNDEDWYNFSFDTKDYKYLYNLSEIGLTDFNEKYLEFNFDSNEDVIFLTEEEAQKKCDELNA